MLLWLYRLPRYLLFQLGDRPRGDGIEAGAAGVGKGDDLADHFRRPEPAEMIGRIRRRLSLRQDPEILADLIGHAYELRHLLRAHAARPPSPVWRCGAGSAKIVA